MTRPLLLLFDGHGLAFRAFYALPEMRNSKGEPVHAILGFTNMVLRFLEAYKPAYAAVSFDRGRPAFRTEAFADYKGQREKTPEGLGWQMEWIERMVPALNLPIYAVSSFEADDVIGTLARKAEADGMDVAIMSGDLDMLQLVTPHVKVLAALRNVKDPVTYDLAAVRERFGLEPERLPDWKALAGDTSDNIPGMAGIGKDSATKLLQEFGSVDGLIDHLQEVPDRWQKKLVGQTAAMRRYRDVATIDTHVDVAVNWQDCARPTWDAWDVPKFVEILDRLEFPSIKSRLGLGGAKPPEVVQLELARPVLTEQKVSLAELRDAWPEEGWVPLYVDAGQMTIAAGDQALTAEASWDDVARLLPGKRVVVPHLKPMLRHMHPERLDRHSFQVFDIALGSYLLHAGLTAHTLDAALRRMGLESLLPVENPAQAVAAMTAALPIFEKAIDEQGLHDILNGLELPLAWPLALMERQGIAVDVPYLKELGQELDTRISALQSEIYGLAGMAFNLNSPKQVGDVFFEHLKLPGAKKTKTGYATGVEILAEMAPFHPIVAKLLQYREVAKLKSTYVDTLPEQISGDPPRVHTTFNQTVAATGRLSSSDPNLQNIPIRSELGKLVRRAFVPSEPGWVLLSADYSQIELRILAHVSGDEHLVAAFRNDEDIHTATSAQVFGLRPEDVTSDIRRRAKEINFGILYGMSAHGLAQRLSIGRKEAQEFIDRYLERFSGVRDYLRSSIRQAEQQGWVSTLQGRRRTIPDINSRNMTVKKAAERMAVNAPIQGTAADFIKKAMIEVYDGLRQGTIPGRLLLQVHDELLLEVPRAQATRAARSVRAAMEGVASLQVPLKVDVSVGCSWADLEEAEEDDVAAQPTLLHG